MSARTLLEMDWPRVRRAREKALLYANEDEDVEVESGMYSAKHWSNKAAASAILAQSYTTTVTGGNGLGYMVAMTLTSDAKTAGDAAALAFLLNNSADESTKYGQALIEIIDPTDGAEEGRFAVQVMKAGTLTTIFQTDGAVGVAYGGTGSTTAPGARTALGLEIGVDVQPWSQSLVAGASPTFSGLTLTGGMIANVTAGENIRVAKSNNAPSFVFGTWAGGILGYFEAGVSGIGVGKTPSTFFDIGGNTSITGTLALSDNLKFANSATSGVIFDNLDNGHIPGIEWRNADGSRTLTVGLLTEANGSYARKDLVVKIKTVADWTTPATEVARFGQGIVTITGTLTSSGGLSVSGASDGSGYLKVQDVLTGSGATDGLRLGFNAGIARLQSFENTAFQFYVNNSVKWLEASAAGNATFSGTIQAATQIAVTGSTPIFYLNADSGSDWQLRVDSSVFGIRNATSGLTPFAISGSAITLSGTGYTDLILTTSNAANSPRIAFENSGDASHAWRIERQDNGNFRLLHSTGATAGSGTNTYPMVFDLNDDLTLVGNIVLGPKKIFIGDTANSNMTIGLTINQGSSNDEFLAIKNSGVSHGYVSSTETDTIFQGTIRATNNGGVSFRAFAEDAAVDGVYQVAAYGGTATTAKTSSGVGLFDFFASEHNGSGALSDITADGNVYSIRARVGGVNRTLFILDEDGEIFADGGTASTDMVTLYDDYDDRHLARAAYLTEHNASGARLTLTAADDVLAHNEDDLILAGLLGAHRKDGGLWNYTGLTRLALGASWQNYLAIEDLREEALGRLHAVEERVDGHDEQIQARDIEIAALRESLSMMQQQLSAAQSQLNRLEA